MTIGLRIRELIKAESKLDERANKRKAASDYLLKKLYENLLEDFKKESESSGKSSKKIAKQKK